ncbi:MAG: hypothetical protein IRZ28_00660 [Steroidobacteraceae bacterium]|nr:hypothetical protein [Steroidobacteraceae bacterium]
MSSEKSSRAVRAALSEVIAHLHRVQSALAVAVSALLEQNADIDADVASLLRTSVRDPLHEQIEKLESLSRRFGAEPGTAAGKRAGQRRGIRTRRPRS